MRTGTRGRAWCWEGVFIEGPLRCVEHEEEEASSPAFPKCGVVAHIPLR